MLASEPTTPLIVLAVLGVFVGIPAAFGLVHQFLARSIEEGTRARPVAKQTFVTALSPDLARAAIVAGHDPSHGQLAKRHNGDLAATLPENGGSITVSFSGHAPKTKVRVHFANQGARHPAQWPGARSRVLASLRSADVHARLA